MVSVLKCCAVISVMCACAVAQANLPSGTTASGTINHKNLSAPSTPSSGRTLIWTDSTSKIFCAKNDAGILSCTVIADSGAAHNFLTAISAAGVISKAQPSFSDLSGSAACSQQPALTGDATSAAGSCSTSVVQVNGAAVPASATALASNSSNQLIAATYQGNGSKVQLSTGSTSTGNCAKFDANGNVIDAGIACSTGGGGTGVSPAGPTIQTYQCDSESNTSSTSITCSSLYNVTSGETYLIFCQYYTNDGGTITLSASDSLTGSWTTDKTFYGTFGYRQSIFRKTFSSSGSTTFTCTSSATAPYISIVVFGAVGISGVDVSTTVNSSGSTAIYATFTTATDNDLGIMFVGSGGNTSGCDMGSQSAATNVGFGATIFSTGAIGTMVGAKKLTAAGFYRMFAHNCNTSNQVIGIAYK